MLKKKSSINTYYDSEQSFEEEDNFEGSEYELADSSEEVSYSEEEHELIEESQYGSDDEEINKNMSFWVPYTDNQRLEAIQLPNPPVSGTNKRMSQLTSPIDFFSLFMDDDLLQHICSMTEIYYQKNKSSKQVSSQKKKKWVAPDLASLKCFLGVMLCMGMIKRPSYKDYWTSSKLFGTPGISELMSCDHFEQIRNSLHFINEDDCDKDDKLYKIRPLIEHFTNVSQSLYSPERELTIDESMIKFNGRSKFKVYMPLKPVKYGFKAYVLTEASTGYLLNWSLYEGEKSSLVDIVSNLASPFAKNGYTIAMDRFYTTLETISTLSELGFRVFGMITKNRARLTENITLSSKKLHRGNALFYCSNDKKTLLTIWKDTKLVHLVSNFGDNTFGETQRRIKARDSDLSEITVTRPNTGCSRINCRRLFPI